MASVIAVCASGRTSDPKIDLGAGELRAGYGLVGDSHAGQSERQISLLDVASIDAVNAEHHIGAVPGSFAENLTLEGLDLLSLRLGDRLRVGPTLLEVVQIGKPLSAAHTYNFRGLSILPHKGVFCRVLEGGVVARGDPVTVRSRGGWITLTCVVDNCVSLPPLWGEHGLSFLVESQGRRLLWDTGGSDAVLLHNLEALEIDLASIEAVALSHGHYDHTGGLRAILEARPGLPVYAHAALMTPRFSRRGETVRSVGLALEPDWLATHCDLRLSREAVEVLPGVWTTGEIVQRPEPQGGGAHLLVRQGDAYAPDPYEDDLSLVLRGREGDALLCGCCHAGLLNVLAHVRVQFDTWPATIVGGTHLAPASAETMARVIDVLRGSPTRRVYANHCTGQEAIVRLAMGLGEAVRPCGAGTVVEIL